MRLTDLDAELLNLATPTSFRVVASLTDAHGISFLCPKCFAVNNGSIGTHSVIVWFEGAPPNQICGTERWKIEGTGLNDLTMIPSINTIGGCEWHGFVRNGDAV